MNQKPVAIVTGGSRGIGRGICIALSEAGYCVAVNYAGNETAAKETQGQLAGDSLLCQGDVSSTTDRQRLVQTTLERWGRIDVLVNNAGITSVGRKDILEATEESWDRVLEVNLKGTYFLCQAVAKEMLRLQENPPPGYEPVLINISSISAIALSMTRGDYCVSKLGVSMATQLFAYRLAEHGIRVFEIRPGIIESDMTAGAQEKYTRLIAEGLTPIRRWGKPEDVGQAVVTLATGKIPYSTGEVFHIDGGFHLRSFPR